MFYKQTGQVLLGEIYEFVTNQVPPSNVSVLSFMTKKRKLVEPNHTTTKINKFGTIFLLISWLPSQLAWTRYSRETVPRVDFTVSVSALVVIVACKFVAAFRQFTNQIHSIPWAFAPCSTKRWGSDTLVALRRERRSEGRFFLDRRLPCS